MHLNLFMFSILTIVIIFTKAILYLEFFVENQDY